MNKIHEQSFYYREKKRYFFVIYQEIKVKTTMRYYQIYHN